MKVIEKNSESMHQPKPKDYGQVLKSAYTVAVVFVAIFSAYAFIYGNLYDMTVIEELGFSHLGIPENSLKNHLIGGLQVTADFILPIGLYIMVGMAIITCSYLLTILLSPWLLRKYNLAKKRIIYDRNDTFFFLCILSTTVTIVAMAIVMYMVSSPYKKGKESAKKIFKEGELDLILVPRTKDTVIVYDSIKARIYRADASRIFYLEKKKANCLYTTPEVKMIKHYYSSDSTVSKKD